MKLLRLLVVVIVVVGLVLRLLGLEFGPTLLWVAGGAEACLVVLVSIGLFRLWRTRSAAAAEEPQPRGWDAVRTVLRESLPEGPAEAVLSEMRVFVAALATLTLRPLRPRITRGRARFGSMGSSVYGSTVLALIVLLVVEAPAVHIVLGAVMDDGAVRSATRGLLLFSSVYLAIWLLGDLRLLKEAAGIVVGDGHLEIDLGLRARGHVDLDNIVRAAIVADEDGDDQDCRPIRLTPMPAPNARVWLRRPVVIRGIFGVPMRGDRLDVFVDDPTALVLALSESDAR